MARSGVLEITSGLPVIRPTISKHYATYRSIHPDWRPSKREFEQVIMVEILIEEMFSSD